jgi:CheY-like chemotaxis protein
VKGGGKSLSEMWTDRLRSRRSTVLVVEPDPVTRQLLSRSLRPGYQVLQAASAEEAVRIAAQHKKHIDLLLTEVRLPHLSGWELLELLALDYPKLKVVYVSKSIDPEIRSHTRRQTVLLLDQPLRDSCLRQAVREGLENQPSKVGMKWTAPSFLLRMRSYFRRHLWMHRATS